MIDTKGIVHFTMPVSDVVQSERFYCDILGLEVVQRVPTLGMLFLKAGPDYVVLCRSKTPINPNPGKDIMVHHAFRVDANGYDKAVAELRASGVEILFEEERRDGVFQGRQAYFHDPDRNVIEINALEQIGEGYGVNSRPENPNHFSHKPPGM